MTEICKYHKYHFAVSVMIFMAIVQLLFSFHISFADEKNCSADCALRDNGWIVHASNNFSTISQKILMKFRKNRNAYVPDTEGFVYCPITKRPFKFVSYDKKDTPQIEMYGDIFLLTDPDASSLTIPIILLKSSVDTNFLVISNATSSGIPSAIRLL